MNCCKPEIALEDVEDESQIETRARCSICESVSRYVTKKTMLLMLKPELFERIGDRQYFFCGGSECPIVYFSEEKETTFSKEDLRVRVGVKEKEDPQPLCYCFGFDEADFKNEIVAVGQSTILSRIIKLVKAGMCACDTTNPSGACCLGDITKAVKRLQNELTVLR